MYNNNKLPGRAVNAHNVHAGQWHGRAAPQQTTRVPIPQQQLQVKQMLDEIEHYKKKISALEYEIQMHKKNFDEEKRAKDDALRRLSQVAGNKLRDGNPAITDLSDTNRPSKLGEKINSLYTEEWIEAFDSLAVSPAFKKSKDGEREICEMLRNIFLICFKTCQELSNEQLYQLKQIAWDFNMKLHLEEEPKQPSDVVAGNKPVHAKPNFSSTIHQPGQRGGFSQSMQVGAGKSPNPIRYGTTVSPHQHNLNSPIKAGPVVPYDNAACDDIIQLGKERRKQDNIHVNEKIKMRCFDRLVLELKERADFMSDKHLQIYTHKCAELCWKMCVQDPPMDIIADVRHGTTIDKKFKEWFSFYSKSGKQVDYVVWPAILLHKDGALIGKGVVQAL